MSAPTLFEQDPAPAIAPVAGPRPLVIGLDVALGTTGIAGPGWVDHLRTGTLRGAERLDHISTQLPTFYRLADLVVIEGASYGSALQNGHDEMAAARWLVRVDLLRRGIPCAIVPPDCRTIYAIGNARPKNPETGQKYTSKQVKGLVRDAVAAHWGIDCTGTTRYDQADAYVLHEMGQDWLGYSGAALPQTHRRALDGVHWPTETVAVAR